MKQTEINRGEEIHRVCGGEGEKMRDACRKRERERERTRGGSNSRRNYERVAPTEREIFAKSRQVALVELCSYFPSTHPMMSTVM